jgi:ADP-ribose pyrophosphatase YjhB (NUDIX family)
MPAGRGHLAGFVEHAAVGAGEGQGLVGVHLAPFQSFTAGCGPHHVVAAILVDGHGPILAYRAGRGSVGVVDRSVPLKTLLRWSESLSAIARTGLGFTESLYEQERFEEILKVAADIRYEADDESGGEDGPDSRDSDGLVQEWMDTVGKGVPGYVTPKVAVGAAVGNDKGELLLIQRADSGIWLYPTGWCDVGYSAAEVVVKEVEEETGIEVEPVRLIAVLDGLRLGFTRVPLYSLLFYCRAVGGSLNPHPLETRDVGWFTRDTMPSPLVGSERWADHVFAALAGERRDVLYDSVRQPMWRGDSQKT